MLHPSRIRTVGALHMQLYLPVSACFAGEVKEGEGFSLSVKSQDVKNWLERNSDIIYQQNDEGWWKSMRSKDVKLQSASFYCHCPCLPPLLLWAPAAGFCCSCVFTFCFAVPGSEMFFVHI